jgi:hypothetical protein
MLEVSFHSGRGKEKESIRVRVLERAQGRYEVQDVEFGKVYRWSPERVMVECDCGERLTLTASRAACGCGADYAAFVREELATFRHPGDEVTHPWHSWGSSEDTGIPF